MRRDASKAGRWRWLRAATLVVLATVLAFVVSQDSANASWNPTASIDLSSYGSEDNADITSYFNEPREDVNFDSIVTFTPSECEGGVPGFLAAADEDVPDGTVVGDLTANPTLGLTIGACSLTALSVSFTMVDANADPDNDFADTGTIDDGTWNGYDPVCAGGLERAICQWPGFLNSIYPGLDSDDVRARYYGHTILGPPFTGLEVIVQFLLFEPGTHLTDHPAFDEAWGYPSVTVLNRTGDPNDVSTPLSPLGDFCAAMTTENTVFGKADNIALRTNPAWESTCCFHSWSRGLPDADGDGFENSLDTCPFCANIDTDPKENVGPDNDAIDGCCDPHPTVADLDYDGDQYENVADNCPLVANGLSQDNQKDTDADGIGDACDPNPNTIDGTRPVTTDDMCVNISGPTYVPPTPTPTATVEASPTPTPTVVEGTPTPQATPTATVVGEYCTPVFPGTYNGLVRINGQPAASGYEVTASIDGEQWGSALVSGGRYAMDIPDHLPTAPPCFEGGTLTFAVDGMTCTPTDDWASGIHNVDLSCAPAAPVTPTTPPVTPTATPVVTATPKVTPTTVPPTGAGGLSGSGPGLPLWAMALASWAGLTIVAGLGTLLAAKRP
jgi:hypothetical protein